MFGQNQVITSQTYPLGNQQIPTSPACEYGVTSAMVELTEEVARYVDTSYELKSALGISAPPEQNSKAADSSLVGTLRSMVASLRSSNAAVSEAIRHLRT